ncbi:MAG: hypothetical protein LC641_01885 [Spirochaeta sp.]|nr:hypothetical protein [Spirochaeta sp.]
MTTEEAKIIAQAREITNKYNLSFLALDDMDLLDRIDTTKHVVYDSILFAQKVGRGEHDCTDPLDGLYFAFNHYQDLVDEAVNRWHEQRKK